MTVLVDDAAWWWRGDKWAHLVSDCSATELHRFANQLGIRRLAYQDDHYDVPVAIREQAIAVGATPVSSRVLVKALRDGGLRRRGRNRWQEGQHELTVGEYQALEPLRRHWPELDHRQFTTVLRRSGQLACSMTVDPNALGSLDVPDAVRDLAYVVVRPEGLVVDVVLAVDG